MSELAHSFLLDMQGSAALDLHALLDELIQAGDRINSLDGKADDIAEGAEEAYTNVDTVNDETGSLADTAREMQSNSEDALAACRTVRSRTGDLQSEVGELTRTFDSLIDRVRQAMGGDHVPT
jgi:methyl-accepting chemotaxis protein